MQFGSLYNPSTFHGEPNLRLMEIRRTRERLLGAGLIGMGSQISFKAGCQIKAYTDSPRSVLLHSNVTGHHEKIPN
jgi:hypothetical protein